MAETRTFVSHAMVDPVWDAFVHAAPGGHHLQSSLWAQVKAAHGWRPVRLLAQQERELLGGVQLLVRSTWFGALAYCARGPLLRDRDDRATLLVLLGALARLARSARILYIKLQLPAGYDELEPALRDAGFVASDMGVAPHTTVRVDLRRSVEEIVAGMRSSARSNIRKATRKGVRVRAAGREGLPAFAELLAATAARQGFPPYAIDYYANILQQFGASERAELLIAELDGEVLAGAILIGYGDTVVYKMGGWAGDRSGVHPNELMHLRAIEWAKAGGYRFYDLDGIEPAAAQAALAGEAIPDTGVVGVTRFKLGLGGEVAIFPRTYDRSFNPLLALPVRLAAPRLLRLQSLAYRLQGRASA